MTSNNRAAARGQRRGFYWQDWYAAWTMLRCVAEPAEGILAVEVEAAGAPHVDDIVVHRRDSVVYQQLKHTVDDDGRFTGAVLFSAPPDGQSLIGKLYKGWDHVRRKAHLPVEVRLITNAVASADPRNQLISPAEFERRIVVPARLESWSPPEDLSNILEEIQKLTGAPDMEALRAFLGCLHFEFGAPDESEVRGRVVQVLSEHLRPEDSVATEADAWTARVYDLATRPGETQPISRTDIDRELRRLFGRNRVAEHRLALPAHHVPRREIVAKILDTVRAQGEGYLVVAGPPGCGKTTLATWIADEYDDELLMRYHVFDPGRASGVERQGRASALEFVRTMFDVLSVRFADDVRPRVPTEDSLSDAVGILRDELARLAGSNTRFVVVDGIDHIVRAGVGRQSLFDALPQPCPARVVFVLFGQPDWDYPPWLRQAPRINIPPFTTQETRAHVCQRLGWDLANPSAAAVADALHSRSGGNPLSLFYNLSLVEGTGGEPDEVAADLPAASLFGDAPHAEYDRLLDDIESQLPAPQGSRSLRREMLACIAIATATVTVERLCRAFSDEPLTPRQARDYLAGLKPIVVERGTGRYWLFHDDFRRYAEERTSREERQEAHRRFASALAADCADDEFGALVEHYWYGGEYERLASLPAERTLDEWFETASPRIIVKLYRMALAAAFRQGDDIHIMRNALAAARAAEAADLAWANDGPPEELGLQGWSFVAPPRGVGFDELRRRAAALHAAAEGCRTDPDLASEIAKRFIIPDECLAPVDQHDWDVTHYVEARTRWLLRSGAATDAAALVADDRSRAAVIAAIRNEFTIETDPEVLGEWASAAANVDETLERDLTGAALEHLIAGRNRASARIVRALLDCSRASCEARRDASVLLSLIEGRVYSQATDINACVYWHPLQMTNPLEWRDFFFDGFVTTSVGSSLELSVCEFPERFEEEMSAEDELSSDIPLVRFIWRAGCAAGLSMRAEDMLTTSELESIIRPLIGEGLPDLVPLQEHVFSDCARVFVPLLAYAVRGAPSLSERMRELLVSAGWDCIVSPSERLYGILEAVWVLAPDEWRSMARTAYEVVFLPGTDASRRSEWFRYWHSKGGDRGAPAPTGFVGRAAMAKLGVPRKTDPAALAVELVCKDSKHPDVAERISRLTDLLIRLDAEPEGGRAVHEHLPSVLALALAADPALFEREFLRCTLEHRVEEAFGSLPGDVAARWLKTEGALTTNELVALWHWVTASPGSFASGSGGEAAGLIADRLAQAGAVEDVALIRRWASAVSAAPDRHHVPSDNLEVRTRAKPTLRIEDIEPRWFSSWWSGEKNLFLRAFLAPGDEARWRAVCDYLSERIARATTSFADEFLLIGEGICDLRSSLPRDKAIELAMHHLSEKVRFQAVPSPISKVPPASQDRVVVLVRLLARGLDVGDVETIRRTLRGLGALVRRPGTRPMVIREMQMRLPTDDARAVICALSVLRQSESLTQDAFDDVRRLQDHPDAWCKWLACAILRTEPAWAPLRDIVTPSGIIAPGAGPTRTEVGNAYYSDTTNVREVYVQKLGALVNKDEYTLRCWIETELRVLPHLEERLLGWHGQRGPQLTNNRVADAVGRLASRLASTVPAHALPMLLSTVAHFDPWLVFAEPSTEPPPTWIEVCRAEVRSEGGHDVYLVQSLGLIHPNALQGPEAPTPNLLAEVGCLQLSPERPQKYAWVAEPWARISPPQMRRGPVIPLSFHNSVFTQLQRDRFDLVPAFGLPPFTQLMFEIADVPRWVHPTLGPVLMAAYKESTANSDSIGHPKMNWWTGWFASPQWLSSFIQGPVRLIRFWRAESAARQYDDTPAESIVEYGLEDVDI